jgi:hydrogenase maturation protease
MRTKLIALGNILMKDDGIAIRIAKTIETELEQAGIEVIYGETDIGYCLSMLNGADRFILLDASYFGKPVGEITVLSLKECRNLNLCRNQHDISLIDLIQLYFPEAEGIVIAIEAGEAGFGTEISLQLSNRLQVILNQVLAITVG